MLDHGISYPTLYQPLDEMLGPALLLRKKAGLPTDRLYVLGISTGNPNDPAGLAELAKGVGQWLKAVSRYGYKTLYIYGMDEAEEDGLKLERAAWKRTEEAGAKLFVACQEGAVDVVGDLLDTAILSQGVFKPKEVARWHSRGKRSAYLWKPPGRRGRSVHLPAQLWICPCALRI